MPSTSMRFCCRSLSWLAVLVFAWVATAALAQEGADPPGRVGHLSLREGGVVFAPQGESDWLPVQPNRPLTAGDRLWTDADGLAEIQIGSATLQLAGQSHIGIGALDERAAQFILMQGSLHARVRDLQAGENFEVDTPNFAVRAQQAGELRVDVDKDNGSSRLVVLAGRITVYGDNGQSLSMAAGQQASFAGRGLARVAGPAYRQDDFGAWAAERDQREDQAVASRYLPRGVIGAGELDAGGTWSQDPDYGVVWYPAVPVADWAPYRYGHWEWIAPWGWTWIDDARWGFAPFHYGRWTMLGNRWAWVPGRLPARPLYAPALVVFVGGANAQFSSHVGPAVGWYPLAPGEAWWPTYRASTRYVASVNGAIDLRGQPRHGQDHFWAQRPQALTTVREEDFRRGRPVYPAWQREHPRFTGPAQTGVVPARPEPRSDRGRDLTAPRAETAAPRVATVPRVEAPSARVGAAPPTVQPAPPARAPVQREVPPLVREEARARVEQERLQRDAERNARAQVREAEAQRQQEEQKLQREQALSRLQQERLQRERGQQERLQQERAQQERAQQERAPRERAERGEREAPPHTRPVPQHVQPAPADSRPQRDIDDLPRWRSRSQAN